MIVKYSGDTKEDFRNHRTYLSGVIKTDGSRFSSENINKFSRNLKKNITKGIENTKEHKDSIFPKEFDYDSENYKMYIDKPSHHIVFYKIKKDNKGRHYISVERLIHSTKLKEELDKKGIKPLENADKSLLDDLDDVYREDEINQKEDNEEEEGKEEEVYDEETGKKVKRIVYTGPQGGRFYKNKRGEKVYVDEGMSKSLKSILLESKMVSLSEYLKREVLKTPPIENNPPPTQSN